VDITTRESCECADIRPGDGRCQYEIFSLFRRAQVAPADGATGTTKRAGSM